MRIFLVLLCVVLAFAVGLIAGNSALTRLPGQPIRWRLLLWLGAVLVPAALLLLVGRMWFGGPTAPGSPAPLLSLFSAWETQAASLPAPAYLLGFLVGSIPSREQIRAWRASPESFRDAAPASPAPAEAPSGEAWSADTAAGNAPSDPPA